MKAQTEEDMVVGIVTGPADGIPVPPELEGLPMARLRFDGEAIVDAAGFASFYIDPDGHKHIADHGPGWPKLACVWDDELLRDGDGWRAPSEADALARAGAEAKARVDRAAEAARGQWLTPGAGQALVYEAKRREAADLFANHSAKDPPPEGKYPLLEAELGITADDLRKVAARVERAAAAAILGAAEIERLRLSAKRAIAAAADTAAIETIPAGLAWPAPSQSTKSKRTKS